MHCKQHRCNGHVDLSENQIHKMGDFETPPLSKCNRCERAYTQDGLPYNDSSGAAYFIVEGVACLV
jgi:hypothetical protein